MFQALSSQIEQEIQNVKKKNTKKKCGSDDYTHLWIYRKPLNVYFK